MFKENDNCLKILSFIEHGFTVVIIELNRGRRERERISKKKEALIFEDVKMIISLSLFLSEKILPHFSTVEIQQ